MMRLASLALALGLSASVSAAAQQAPEPAASGDLGAFSQAPLSEPGLYEAALARLNERLSLYPDDHEASLLKSLLFFKSGRMGDALTELNTLTRRAPRFHLAHLIHGDLDNVIAPRFSQEAAQALQALGGQVTHDSVPGLGHGIDATAFGHMVTRLQA